MMRYLRGFLALFLATVSAGAAPSLVKLDSGERLLGDVLPKSTDELLVMRSSLLGEISVPRSRILLIGPIEPKEEVAKGAAVPEVKAPAESKPVVDTPPASPPDTETASDRKATPKSETKGNAALRKPYQIVASLRELKAPEVWSGNVRFGINLSSGDKKWTESYARGKLEIKPERSPNFYRFAGSYTYRQSERNSGETFKSTDRYDAEFTYRRSFGAGSWFFQNALGGRVDRIKGIKHEIQDTVGIGYQFEPSETFEILFGGGGGVEDLEVEFQDTRSGFNTVMNVFQEATWRPLKRTTFVQRFNYYWNPDDSEQFNYVVTAAVRVRLTDLLGLEFSFDKNFDNDVGDGNAKDDVRWRNALVVYF